jgi:hypothetical protein
VHGPAVAADDRREVVINMCPRSPSRLRAPQKEPRRGAPAGAAAAATAPSPVAPAPLSMFVAAARGPGRSPCPSGRAARGWKSRPRRGRRCRRSRPRCAAARGRRASDEVAALLVERRGQLARHEPVQKRVRHHRERVARRRVLAAADEQAYDPSAPRHRVGRAGFLARALGGGGVGTSSFIAVAVARAGTALRRIGRLRRLGAHRLNGS